MSGCSGTISRRKRTWRRSTAAGDGVYEHIVSDERRSEASLDAGVRRGARALQPAARDGRRMRRAITKTKSGKTVTIALTSPAIAESLTIQDVAISEIGIAPTLKPKFTVTASSVRHSFDAILQHADPKGGRLMAIDRAPVECARRRRRLEPRRHGLEQRQDQDGPARSGRRAIGRVRARFRHSG